MSHLIYKFNDLAFFDRERNSTTFELYVFKKNNLPVRTGCNSRSIFERSKADFEFIVFLLLDWLPKQSQETQSA